MPQSKASKHFSHSAIKGQLHPRNKHHQRYDFKRLVNACPELASKVVKTPTGEDSIHFSDPDSVKVLNQAILKADYGVQHWELAAGHLCPPIPGRVDMLHYVADLLAQSSQMPLKKLKQQPITGLDIGCGASLIYPLLGKSVYNWRFVGSDIHPQSIAAATALIEKNQLSKEVSCRLQSQSDAFFRNIILENEFYHFTVCNPPFHRSAEEALSGSQRKRNNLSANQQKKGVSTNRIQALLNFSGQANELWCDGGEAKFVSNMIRESRQFARQCHWFTSLVAKKENLRAIKTALKRAQVKQHKVITMSQGQKISRIVCWSFYESQELVQHFKT